MKSLILLFSVFYLSCTTSAQMTFQKEQNTQRLIAVAELSGKNQYILSDPKLDTYHPDISASGRYVAYSQGRIQNPITLGPPTELEIVIKDLNQKITEIWSAKANQFIHVEFSGNERFLAFSGPNLKNNKQNIHIVDLIQERKKGPSFIKKEIGSTIHIYQPSYHIIESEYDCYAPAVSSNGELIVYHRTQDKSNKKAPKQLMVYNTLTKKEFEITDSDKHAMFPSISADDRYIAYVSQDHGQWDIFTYDLWTKTKKQLTNDAEVEFTPSFRDNNEIYFTRFVQTDNDEVLIDLYYLPSQSLNSQEFQKPIAFLNEERVAEYVPSFSNSADLKKNDFANFPSPERSSFGSVAHNSKVYIAGGHQGPEHTYPKESFLDTLQVYDTQTQTWTTLTPMNEAKHGFQMAAYNNYIYVFGGFTFSDQHKPQWKSVDTIERYDINNNTWTTLNVKLPRRRSSNALAVVDDIVYFIGGWDSTPKTANDKEGVFHPEIDTFDLKTETVSTLATQLTPPLRRALTAVSLNDEIYLLGGIGQGASHFDWVDNVTVFKPKLNTWEEKSPLPFPTFAPGAGVINDKIFFIGGMILKDIKTFDLNYVDDIYVMDTKKDKWFHSGVYLNENKGFPQVVPLNNKELGILGGHTYLQSPQGIIDHPVSSFESVKLK